MRNQQRCTINKAQLLNGKAAIQGGNDDIATLGMQRAIHTQHVTGENPGINHGIPIRFDPQIKGRRRVAHAILVEVEHLLNVVIGRAGETGSDAGEHQGQRQVWRFRWGRADVGNLCGWWGGEGFHVGMIARSC